MHNQLGVLQCAWIQLGLIVLALSAERIRAEDLAAEVLTTDEWNRIDDSIDLSLEWLANQQQRDGFVSYNATRPARSDELVHISISCPR